MADQQTLGTHKLVRGDTWDTLAKTYGATAAQLKAWNPGLLKPNAFHGGAGIQVPVLSQTQNSAYDLMANTLSGWGLSALLPDLKKFIVRGDTGDTLSLALSQTAEYKKRFSGNELRKAQGLSTLSPASYIALEESYRNIMQSYGLPKNFYDQHEDFADFIGKDISAAELQSRAQIAHDQYEAAPTYMKDLWSQYFGSKGDALAAILDPNTATSVIQDRSAQIGIGGTAAEQGLALGQSRAAQFQQAGVTLAGARKAYQQIASAQVNDQQIASRFGTTFDQSQEENDLLLGDAAAGLKRQGLYNSEKALFTGSGGVTSESLGVSQSY